MTQQIRFRVLGNRVLIKQFAAEEVSRGGIVIPDVAKEKPAKGKVLAIGPGKTLLDGKTLRPHIDEGDTVVFSRYAAADIKVDNQELTVVDADSIIGIDLT